MRMKLGIVRLSGAVVEVDCGPSTPLIAVLDSGLLPAAIVCRPLNTDASVRIGTTLELERTAQELAEVAVPDLADVVIVDVLETVAAGAAPGVGLVGGATLRRLGKAPLSGSPVADSPSSSRP